MQKNRINDAFEKKNMQKKQAGFIDECDCLTLKQIDQILTLVHFKKVDSKQKAS